MSSPNMNLNIPVPSQTGGPQYALDEVSCFQQIDSHNHTTGQGVPIPLSALIIDENFSMNGFSVTDLKSIKLSSSVISPGSGSVFMMNSNLYWTPGGGGPSVQITNGSAISGAPGNITDLVPPASVTFVSASSTYVFESNTNTPGHIDAAHLTIRNSTVSSNGITLQPPTPLGADYDITLPATLPAANNILRMSTIGGITNNLSVDGSSIQIVSNVMSVGNSGIVPRSTGNPVGIGGVAVSASCGAFYATTAAPVPVTNLSVTLTTTGNPVILMMSPDPFNGGANPSYIRVRMPGSASQSGYIYWFNGAVQLARTSAFATVGNVIPPPASDWFSVGLPGGIMQMCFPIAGTHTFSVKANISQSGTDPALAIGHFVLIAYEI